MEEKEIEGKVEVTKVRNTDRIYDVLAIILGLVSLGLGFLIYANNDINGVYISKLFHQDINFVDFNNKVNTFFDNFLKFDHSRGESEPVLGEVQYIVLGDDRYQTSDNYVACLDDGTITYVTSESDGTYSIVVSYDLFVAIYSNVTDTNVHSGDRLESGESIGGYEEYFKARFKRGDDFITYPEIFL